jgi:hypothetical protein
VHAQRWRFDYLIIVLRVSFPFFLDATLGALGVMGRVIYLVGSKCSACC